MATFVSTKLGAGVVSDSKTSIASPSGVKWLVHSLRFHNLTASPVSVEVFYNDGTSRREQAFDVPGDDTVEIEYIGNGNVVEDGDSIESVASVAASVNYFIDGAVRTA